MRKGIHLKLQGSSGLVSLFYVATYNQQYKPSATNIAPRKVMQISHHPFRQNSFVQLHTGWCPDTWTADGGEVHMCIHV